MSLCLRIVSGGFLQQNSLSDGQGVEQTASHYEVADFFQANSVPPVPDRHSHQLSADLLSAQSWISCVHGRGYNPHLVGT